MIDLDAHPVARYPSRLAQVRRALSAPAPAALVLLMMALIPLFLAAIAPTSLAPAVAVSPVEHLVQMGVSAYPATAVAQWVDSAGVSHDLDAWADQPVRVPARSVFVAVAAGADAVQCTLVVDGRTADSQTARNGIKVCQWSAVT